MDSVDLLGEPPTRRSTRRPHDRRSRRVAIAICGVVGALVLVAVGARCLTGWWSGSAPGAVPFYGSFGWRATWSMVLPVGAAALIVTTAPALAVERDGPRSSLSVGGHRAVVGAARGQCRVGALSSGLTSRYDYLPVVPAARALGLGRFLQTYVDRLGSYPVHVQGHPPGMVALLWLLDAVGLDGEGWEAVTIILIGATTPVAALLATWALAGLDAARTAAPFLVLAPWTLFLATIGDAVFTAMAAWTIALFVVASRRTPVLHTSWPPRRWVTALTLHFTYGLVPLLVVVPAAILVAQRRPVLAAPAAAGALPVTAAWVAAGFWWLAGFKPLALARRRCLGRSPLPLLPVR